MIDRLSAALSQNHDDDHVKSEIAYILAKLMNRYIEENRAHNAVDFVWNHEKRGCNCEAHREDSSNTTIIDETCNSKGGSA